MTSDTYYLSPYCVCYPEPDNETVTLIHSHFGTKLSISGALFQKLIGFLGGQQLNHALANASEEARESLETLIAEQVLIGREEFDSLRGSAPFKNRLQPVEQAFHRGMNEGGYFPELVGDEAPPPAWKDYSDAGHVKLKIHESLEQKDLVQCLSERRSIRRYSERPLSLPELEQFVQLSCKAYALVETPELGAISLRNYPSGGARYPLEIYPAIFNVAELPSGFYHYQPFQHHLTPLNCSPDYPSLLMRECKRRLASPDQQSGEPAVIFIITAMFARTCWKYSGTPHHLILKEVGALYQTMYLVANLLNLACCPIGAFPGRAIDEMLNLQGNDESTVGIFLLGSPGSVEEPVLEVKELRVLDSSPFSSDATGKSVEFSFMNGEKEIMDRSGVRVEFSSDGTPYCWVMRRRRQAFLSPEAEARLSQLLSTPEQR